MRRVTTIDCEEGECVVSCIDRQDVLHSVSPKLERAKRIRW